MIVFALFCYALLCVLSSFAIIIEEEERAGCFAFIVLRMSWMWLFLAVLWVGLQCVIVVFPDHTHLFFMPKFPKFSNKC